MGLLEKAEKIQTEDKVDVTPAPVVAAVAEPEPVKVAKKSRRERRERKPKKTRPIKEKKIRTPKTLPDGFESATNLQKRTRRFVDFAVSYGWSIPILGLQGFGGGADTTYFIILGILLTIGNLVILPAYTNRSIGNWVSRTRYVNTRGENPLWPFLTIKGLTTSFVLISSFAILVIMSELSMGDSTLGTIFRVIGLILIIPPLVDYIMYKRRANGLGLWDTFFGGVWMVKTGKTAEAKGWLKRLESLGDFAESRGLLKESEDVE
ncbi:MAG: hypothetical protein ACPG68_01355 [Candidatus Thalassarchaeaceae archaeon]|jgi:hypothetical protein